MDGTVLKKRDIRTKKRGSKNLAGDAMATVIPP